MKSVVALDKGILANTQGAVAVNGSTIDTTAVQGNIQAINRGNISIKAMDTVKAAEISSENAGVVNISGANGVTATGSGSSVTIKGETIASVGEPTSASETGTVTVSGKADAAIDSVQSNNGTVNVTAKGTATIDTITQDASSTVIVAGSPVKVATYRANGATIDVAGGSSLTIQNFNGENNMFGIAVNQDPKKSSYLVFENADLKIGKTSLSKATDLDKPFLTAAGIQGNMTEGDFYYGALSIGLDESAMVDLNGLSALDSALALDMTPSVRAGKFGGTHYNDSVVKDTDTTWARYSNVQYRPDGASVSSNQLEVGVERTMPTSFGQNHVGVAFSYGHAHGAINGFPSHVKANKYEGKAYMTSYFNSGIYSNVVAKLGHIKNDFDFAIGSNMMTGDYGTNYMSLSAEYGMKKDLTNGWYGVSQA